MPEDPARAEAKKVISELRESAAKIIKRSKELAEEGLRLKQRADDLEQMITQRDARKDK
jgi:hypothetical protein